MQVGFLVVFLIWTVGSITLSHQSTTAQGVDCSTVCNEGCYDYADDMYAQCQAGNMCTGCVKTACTSGTSYQDQEGQAACKAVTVASCGSGKYYTAATSTANGKCSSCPTNTYQDQTFHMSTSCKPCRSCTSGFTDTGGCDQNNIINRICEDITPPVIILKRPDMSELEGNVYVVEAGAPLPPLTATATDTAGSASITSQPTQQEIDNFNTATPSSDQTLFYKAEDQHQQTTTRTITVIVQDTTKPIIEFDTNILYLEAGVVPSDEQYREGATIVDNVDMMLTSQLQYDANNVNVNMLGTYVITYSMEGTDSSGLQADPVQRTVIVRDTMKPVISVDFGTRVVMNNNVNHEGATPFMFPAISATDSFEGGVDVMLQQTPTDVEVNSAHGTQFTLVYTAKDSSINVASMTFTITIVDTTPPVLTLIGASNVFHEAATTYTDLEANATDTLDNARGLDVIPTVTSNTVNSVPNSVPSTFMVVYEACDKTGNCVSKSRTVIVRDTTPPSISLLGDNPYVLEGGDAFSTVPYVTFMDTYDSNPSLSVDQGGFTPTPSNTPASFNVTYSVKDGSNNMNSVTRTITVVDTTPPHLELLHATVTVGDGVPWNDTDLVTSALDIIDGNVLAQVKSITTLTGEGVLYPTSCPKSDATAFSPPIQPREFALPRNNTVDVGARSGTKYNVEYVVFDRRGNRGSVDLDVIVYDRSDPQLFIEGEPIVRLEFGHGYEELGAKASDAHDGDISGNICVAVAVAMEGSGFIENANVASIASDILNNTPYSQIYSYDLDIVSGFGDQYDVGTVFVIRYTVHDRADNDATIFRAVVIVDSTKPTLTLRGDQSISVLFATEYREPGYRATDIHDGNNLDDKVVVSGIDAIDTRQPGEYALTYSITDTNGNTAVKSRTVIVGENVFPADYLIGVMALELPSSLLRDTIEETQAYLTEFLNLQIPMYYQQYRPNDVVPSPVFAVILQTYPGRDRPPQTQQQGQRRRVVGDWLQADVNNVATIEFGVLDQATLSSWVDVHPSLDVVNENKVFASVQSATSADYSPKKKTVAGIVVGVLIAIILLSVGGFFVYKHVYIPYQNEKELRKFDNDARTSQFNPVYRANNAHIGAVGPSSVYATTDAIDRPRVFSPEVYDSSLLEVNDNAARNMSASFTGDLPTALGLYDAPRFENGVGRRGQNTSEETNVYDSPRVTISANVGQKQTPHSLSSAFHGTTPLVQADMYDYPIKEDSTDVSGNIYSVPRNQHPALQSGDMYDYPNKEDSTDVPGNMYSVPRNPPPMTRSELMNKTSSTNVHNPHSQQLPLTRHATLFEKPTTNETMVETSDKYDDADGAAEDDALVGNFLDVAGLHIYGNLPDSGDDDEYDDEFDDPMDVSHMLGYFGAQSRQQIQDKLHGKSVGTYLWRTKGDNVALSLIGRSGKVEHHLFTYFDGLVLMNGKKTSAPCANMNEMQALLSKSREQASATLVNPLFDEMEC
eukprot:m.116415 g.116415  ORF g.116415 m.116415 type:complete len:1474 (+) comp9304_c1_seq5:25-4446(+)